jgi:hypothetical protein
MVVWGFRSSRRSGSGELVLDVPRKVADAGFLSASVTSFVAKDDGVFPLDAEVDGVRVSDGAWALVFPVGGCGDVRGEYGARSGMVVGRPVRSFSAVVARLA